MVVIVTADPNDRNFVIDLSETNLIPGEEIFIFGFVDNNYTNGIPNPNTGDYVGFYFDSDNWKTSYTLNNGYNPEINIPINRRVYDFDSEIRGTVYGNHAGELTLIAYAGELNSLDFDNFDINGIIGYKKLAKNESPISYTLDIMPYGYELPIPNVYIIAMLDRNGNSKPDAGDMIGFHSVEDNKLPTLITINEGRVTDKNVDITMDIAEESGYDRPIRGSIDLPEGAIYDNNSKPIYLIVAKTNDPNMIIDDPLHSIKYFEKIKPTPGGAHIIEFDINLSGTDLNAGDDIFITALWDMDYTSGFPYPNKGDYIGFYMDSDALSPTYILKDGNNSDICFSADRMIYSYTSEIKGAAIGDDTGDLIIIAYAGEINSLDFKNALDFNDVIGYQKIRKEEAQTNYTIKILPYGYNVPIRNVYIIGILDKNGNGKPDAGDKIGFHTEEENNLPTLVTVYEGTVTNKHIEMTMELSESTGYDKPLRGSFELPEGQIYIKNSKPLYLIVAKTDDPNKLLDDPINTIKYFEKIKQPEEGTQIIEFNIDLSGTDLKAGDEIFITALWDKDFTAGFPYPTKGDYIGYYINTDAMSPTYRLEEGDNSYVHFKANRMVYSFEAEIEGVVFGDDTGELTIVAYTGEINSMDFKNALDFDAVIGYQKITKDALYTNYTLRILPYAKNVPIENVYLIAFLDKNGNNIPDGGDIIGFHTNDEHRLPTLITVNEGAAMDKNIDLIMALSEPSGYNTPLSGSFEMPGTETYNKNSKPVYLIIAQTDDPSKLVDDPMGKIKYFEKIEPTEAGAHTVEFNIDLSGTDLRAGDEILITALWDMDLTAGLPYPTEGDYIGFYMNAEAMSPTYTLKDGVNDVIHFKLNRDVYDYEAGVSGTIAGSVPGEVTIIAYTGEINSFDLTNAIDLDAVVGYQTLASNETAYDLSILPYGANVPIQNVYIIAFIDQNGNGIPDAGDTIGFHTEGDNLPALISIDEGALESINIQMMMVLSEPGGYDIPLSGAIDMPADEDYDSNTKPVFLIISQTDDPAAMLENPVEGIKYFKKIIAPAETIDFNIDLSETDLQAGDDILITAIWDKDYNAGFPFPTENDYIGFYMDTDSMSPTYKLKDIENDQINLSVNRIVYEYDAVISGTVAGDDTGELMIVAYAGELNSLDFKDLDLDAIIGYKNMTKGASDLGYSLKILPYGYNVPIQDVYIIGFLDKNGNGAPDGGDKIGFYLDAQVYLESGTKLPGLITINEGELTNIDIEMMMDLTDPSPDVISIAGQFEKPAGYDINSTEPIFILVAQLENNDPGQLFNNPINSIKQFYQMPPGENIFDIDLTDTDIVIGDDVFVIAIWDMDYVTGFPNPTPDDYVGFLQNKDEFAFSINLAEGVNTVPSAGYEFKINKKIYDHDSSITYKLEHGDAYDDECAAGLFLNGQVMVIAIQGDGVDTDSMIMDMDYIIGNAMIEPPMFIDDYGDDASFNMTILPAIDNRINVAPPFEISDVYIFCIHDSDGDGKPESGDLIGFYYTEGGIIWNQPRAWYLTNTENILDKTLLLTTYTTY